MTGIAYGVFESGLGRVLVAATERDVRAVFIGDDDAALEAELRAAFPGERIECAPKRVGIFAEQVLRLALAAPALPLRPALSGTPFQVKVWEALLQIPAGETRTYTEVAEAIGRPEAVRAVAGACAANKIALIVPCHRVVRSDGTLGGYRWGIERKRRLLELEAMVAEAMRSA